MPALSAFIRRAAIGSVLAGVAVAGVAVGGRDGAEAAKRCRPHGPAVVMPGVKLPAVLTQAPADTVRTTTIGYSTATKFDNGSPVGGYPIVAWERGVEWEKATKVAVVLGQIHGDEFTQLDELEAVKTMPVPAGWSLIIIPTGNPDGAASASIKRFGRRNVNGVDLNRNWSYGFRPSACGSKWGGAKAMDQVETQVLARFIEMVRPQLQVTLHADLNSIISANTPDATRAGDAWLAAYIAAKGPNAPRHTHSSPSTGGQMTDWVAGRMAESQFNQSTASLLVEIRPCHRPRQSVVANKVRGCGAGVAWYKSLQVNAHVAGMLAAMNVAPDRPAHLLPKPPETVAPETTVGG